MNSLNTSRLRTALGAVVATFAVAVLLTSPVHAASPSAPNKVAAKPAANALARDISGLPDVNPTSLANFPKMSCSMKLTLPKAAVKHVHFKLEFGPGKVQQIHFDDPLQWSEEAKPQVEKVTAWAAEVQEYMGCLRGWRNEFITQLNPVIQYYNTIQDLIEQDRHAELEVLDSPLRGRGAPFAYTCRLPEPVVGEPSDLEVATFDNCVQRHVVAHERFIEARKTELSDATKRVIERAQLSN